MTPTAMLKYTRKELSTIHINLMSLMNVVESYLKVTAEDIVEKEPEEITHSSQYNPINPPGICVIEEPVSEIFTRLVGILYDVSGCDIAKITQKVTPKELGIDNMDMFEFCIAIEEEYGIEISKDESYQFPHYPFSKIVSYIEDLVKKSSEPIFKSNIHYNRGWK